ncbi:MAG: DPP IV N-terminal domain-containing protein [Mucinivorans sp.]
MKNLIFTLITICSSCLAVASEPGVEPGVAGDALGVVDYEVINRGEFSPSGVPGFRSMKDGQHYTALAADRRSIVRYRFVDGLAVDTIFSMRDLVPSVTITSYTLSDDENLILIPFAREPIFRHSFRADYWIYDRLDKQYYPLSKNGKQQAATISPDSRKAAFVRDNNLYVVDLVRGTERAVTSDGEQGSILNGIPDWVYEEEYGFDRAYQWSPSSSWIAFYRTDESKVKNYPMPIFERGLYPENTTFKYPKAGETNSTVQIRIYNIESGKQQLMDIGRQTDQYIPFIEWTGREGELAVHRLNRHQNHYDMLFCNAVSGMSQVIYSESSHRYIERIDKSKVYFLPQSSSFIIRNENDGFMHLYLYDMSGKMLSELTPGQEEVTELNAVDQKNRIIYYTATQGPLHRALYAARYGRGGVRQWRVSDPRPGTYSAAFARGAKYYIESFSTSTTPPVVTIRDVKGEAIRVVEDNAALRGRVAQYAMPRKEFFTFTLPSGEVLNGYMLKPHDFDSLKTYPLFMTQYSGPGSQTVADNWSVGWEAALVKDGYLVASVDGRGTGFRGYEFRSLTYGQLGKFELEDQIAAAKYLGSLPYVDSQRIGIYGWSYGGFMALNAILKGADVFALAVAVAPVTSWRYYDTIYTELYNGLPAENPMGYDENSPLNFAAGLKGKLLLAHGTADDNVHIQNSMDMISALTGAGKQFEMLIYPDRNHGMGADRNHLMHRIIEFVNANL